MSSFSTRCCFRSKAVGTVALIILLDLLQILGVYIITENHQQDSHQLENETSSFSIFQTKNLLHAKTTRRNNPDDTNKPYFILHIGIPKSATTTIQCGLSSLSRELALLDHLYYLGIPCADNATLGNGETALQGFKLKRELDAAKLGSVGQVLQERLRHHSRHNHSIVLSSENFHLGFFRSKSWDLLKSLTQEFHVTIVVTYRRYSEWLPSKYYQSNYYKKQSTDNSLLTYIQDALNDTTNDMDIHPATKAFAKYRLHFDDVFIFNMHHQDGGDLVTNFICQALGNQATNTCQYRMASSQATTTTTTSIDPTTQKGKQVFQNRISHSLDFAKFSSEAAATFGYSINGTHKERFESFRLEHTNEYHSLQSCLPQSDQERLLSVSLAMERRLVKVAASSNPSFVELMTNEQKQHYDAFYHAAEIKRTYCEIDATRALADATFMEHVFGRQQA